MHLQIMHSILRDLFRQVPSYVAPTPEPEERMARPAQYPVAESWSVETVETYSLPEDRKADPAHVWKRPIPCLDPRSYDPFSVEFTHFLDGIQRTSRVREILWRSEGFGTVPMFVAQIACVVLKRADRKPSYCATESDFKVLVEAPIQFLIRNARKNVSAAFENLQQDRSFEWVDTSYATQQSDDEKDSIQVPPLKGYYPRIADAQFKENLSDPNWLSNQSRKWTTKRRNASEQTVFDHLADTYGSLTADRRHFTFFVADGTLSAARGKFVTSAISLSKSFNTRFLEPHLQTRVTDMEGYHRSPVFKFEREARGTEPDEVEYEEKPAVKSPQRNTALSWYVRIRPGQRTAPYWGLLRAEIHPSLLPCKGSADRWAEEDSRLISAISARIMAEACPTSHPDPRWHNLLYPICLCERFARSKMIAHETVKHLFTWGRAMHE